MSPLGRRHMLQGSGMLLAGGLLGRAGDALAAPTAVRPFGIAQLTDIHVSLDGPDWLELFQQSRRIFQRAVDELNASPDVDLVLMTGDLFEANHPASADMDAFLEIANTLKKPWLAMVGNREVDPVPPELCRDKAEVVKLLQGHGYTGDGYNWSFAPIPGWQILALDTTVAGEVEGEVTKESLAWLDDRLAAHASERVLLATHHLLRPTWGDASIPKWTKSYVTHNASDVIARIEKASQVKLTIAGHMHLTHVQIANGLPYAESPALIQYPHAYRVWRLFPDRIEATRHKVQLPEVVAQGLGFFRASAHARTYSADADVAQKWVEASDADQRPVLPLR